jgi:hypothetical protein
VRIIERRIHTSRLGSERGGETDSGRPDQHNISFQFFDDQQPLQKFPSYTKRIESPVGDDEVLCGLEPNVRQCGMRLVAGRALFGSEKLN